MRSWLPPFVKTTFLLFLFHFTFVFSGRVLFFFFCKPLSISQESGLENAFFKGILFDLIISSYALMIPATVLFLSDLISKHRKPFARISFVFTFLAFSLSGLLFFTNLPYFKQFGTHITRSIFLWNASPGFIIGLIFGSISYYGFLILFLAYELILFKLVSAVHARHIHDKPYLSITRNIFLYFLLSIVLFLGARGRLSLKSPAHSGLAIVGPDAFVNQVALNPHYTFFNSFFSQSNEEYREPEYLSHAFRFTKRYLNSNDSLAYSIKRLQEADTSFAPYNVIIVCMESMSAYKTGVHKREILTPYFNGIIKQSLLFDRFFATGIHTSNGLFSVCSGFPSLPGEQPLIKYSGRPFTTLANLLSEKNYSTWFFSTHDPEFDNMGGFFRLNGFKNIYSGLDMPSEKNISVTGVPDHELFDFFIAKINHQKSKNFLALIMTGSDHGPWKIPEKIPFTPTANTPEKRSTQYADWALGQFIEKAKKQSWYKNTLFVFVGDHGSYFDGTYEMALSYHHVPFVMHMPEFIKPDTSHRLGAQYDVLSTVAGFMKLEFTNTSFGKNLLKDKHDFICISADDKTGCLNDAGYFYFKHLGQNFKRLLKYEKLDPLDYYSSEKHIADSIELRNKYFLSTAEYILNRQHTQ